MRDNSRLLLACALVAGCSSGGSGTTQGSGGTAGAHSLGGSAGQSSGGTPSEPSGGQAGAGQPNAGMGGASGGSAGQSGGAGAGPAAGGETASSAAAFLSSIGVCAHVGQGVDDPAKSATAMAFAGIGNLRDDGDQAHIKDWIAMYQQAGVRTDILTDHVVASTIDTAKQLQAAGALLAVEGANEPNNFAVTYENKKSDYMTTFVPVAHLQRDLYQAVKAEPSLANVPVFHSSEAGGSEPDNVGLQFLTIPKGAGTTMPEGTVYADYANTHNYVCGHSSKLVDNTCWNAEDPTLNGDWDGLYVEYGHTWHGAFSGYANADLPALPKVTTETGWVTSGTGAITEEQQARLFLNLYLSAFKRNWSYTFIYMLRDDPVQGYWGLFNVDYTPKKSGTYLHNLTTVLADTGTFTPGQLQYSLGTVPSTVHELLLQKKSGSFELVVWNERPGGGEDQVNLTFPTSRALVKIYDPTTGTAPTQTLNNVTSVPLTLSDHPMVVEL